MCCAVAILDCRVAEEAREAERRCREGDAYRTPEERAEAARAARLAQAKGRAESLEAAALERRFDPTRDYYGLLEIPRCVPAAASCRPMKHAPHAHDPVPARLCASRTPAQTSAHQRAASRAAPRAALPACRSASAAEVRRAFKRLALLLHPDKYSSEGEEQRAAIQDKFKQASRGCRMWHTLAGKCCPSRLPPTASHPGAAERMWWFRAVRRLWRRLTCCRMRSSGACTTSAGTTWWGKGKRAVFLNKNPALSHCACPGWASQLL
jgi:hypothetical protein